MGIFNSLNANVECEIYRRNASILKAFFCNISFRLQLDKRIVTFIYNALNSSNCVSRSLLQSKLHCTGSTFASNYRHLSYKYNICEEDWFSGLSPLLGKVKMLLAEINKSCIYSTQALIELCGIRDGTIQCNILNHNEVCALIDVLSTN